MSGDPQNTWFPFDGQWLPDADPLSIGAKNFKTLKNMRYTDASIEGVAGYSKINTSALTTYIKIRNGFHFKKDQPSESHVIVQAWNTGLTASVVYENETAIPSQGAFTATALHSDASGAGVGRFTSGPRGTVVYCNGKESMIWSGNEAPVSAFITSTAAITNSITNPRDFTAKVQNTLQTEDQIALIGGGKDSTTVLLLHCDGADASTTFTDAIGTHAPAAGGDAQIDVAQAVFGSGSIIFDGTGDYISIADHANFNYGTGTLTIDFRVRFNAVIGMQVLYIQKDGTNGDHIVLWQDHTEGKIHFQVTDAGASVVNESATWAPSAATWYHFAVIRGWGGAANDWAICVGGTAIHTFTANVTMPDHDQAVLLGGGMGDYVLDYTARHPAVTVSGGATRSSTEKKFGSGAWYFDGSNDELTVAASGTDFNLPNQTNFTLDFWVKLSEHTGTDALLGLRIDANNYWEFRNVHGTGLEFLVATGGVARYTLAADLDAGAGTDGISDTNWHHIAVIKVGDEFGIYVDGIQKAHQTDANLYDLSNGSFNVAALHGGSYTKGYFEDIRITHTNLFTAAPVAGLTDTITIPTTVVSADSNTKILIRGDLADFNGWIDEIRIKKASAAWTADFTLPVRAYADQALYWVVGSTRPLKGVKAYVKNANTESAPTITGTYWNGYSWTSLTTFVDNTSGLTATGTMTWDSTVNTAKPKYLNGYYLYFYQFQLSAGEADLYYFTVDAPFQNIIDIWDGVDRQPTLFQASRSSVYEDYTLEVNTPSTIADPIAATIGGLTNADHVIIGFDERTTAIKFQMIAGKTNTTAVATSIAYWDGSAWVSVGSVVDLTEDAGGTKTLNQTGVMSWTPPDIEAEFPQELFGVTGYFYRLTFSDTLLDGSSHDGTSVGIVTGIPAQQKMSPYKFASTFKNMIMLCGITESNEGNRVDFTMPNAPDVYNGELSSMNGLQSLYFGGAEDLTAAVELYNRFGSNIFTTWVVFKNAETYLVTGNTPEEMQKGINPISHNIGCPAPLTLVTAELGYEFAEDAQRNIAIWLSNAGPMMFDGGVFVPLKGIDTFFDPESDTTINFDAISNSIAYFDPIYKEYNLLIPTGTSTTCNTWLVFDLVRRKWYQKDTGASAYIQAAFPVIDTHGKRYTYAGIDTGYMMRLENGTTWDGVSIAHQVETGDFFPANSPWVVTQLRKVNIAVKRISENVNISATHYPNTDTILDGDWSLTPYSSSSNNRILRTTEPNAFDSWAHRLKFSVSTDSTAKGFQPIGWGYEFEVIRQDTIAMATPSKISRVTSDYTVSQNDEIIFATGDVTITLGPAANSWHTVIFNVGTGNVQYQVSVTGDTIEGDTNRVLTKQYESVELNGNGVNLYAEV